MRNVSGVLTWNSVMLCVHFGIMVILTMLVQAIQVQGISLLFCGLDQVYSASTDADCGGRPRQLFLEEEQFSPFWLNLFLFPFIDVCRPGQDFSLSLHLALSSAGWSRVGADVWSLKQIL